MKPSPKVQRPIKLAESSFIIASQAAIIKRQRVEIAALKKVIDTMTRHAEGIKKAAADGVLSLLEL